jgi:hypothetical protein
MTFVTICLPVGVYQKMLHSSDRLRDTHIGTEGVTSERQTEREGEREREAIEETSLLQGAFILGSASQTSRNDYRFSSRKLVTKWR